ncbi:MAG: protease modulator HflC [Myxococcota bacterium]|nr:protease modulator HflC [Myxococcota bacterium]
MKASQGLLAFVLVLLVASVVGGPCYIVDETETVVVTQFGKPVGVAVTTPGLKFKMPFVQTANRFEKRFLEWDGDPNQIPTRDKRFIWVDTTARWRISDPLLFFQRLRDERGAQSRLDDILDGATRNTIAKHNLIQLVRSSNRTPTSQPELGGNQDKLDEIGDGRNELATQVLAAGAVGVEDLGIEILDFRFKRINYVEEVRTEVYTRMISERNRIAEQYRSEGHGEAAAIQGKQERELKLISSEAYRTAEEIKGKADGAAADIYAEAYNKDPKVYAFLKTMELYRTTLDENTTAILRTDGDFLRFLDEEN